MTAETEFALRTLADLWPDLPRLCGAAWPAVRWHLERTLEHLAAALAPDPDAYLREQLRRAFAAYPGVLARLTPRAGPYVPANAPEHTQGAIPAALTDHSPTEYAPVRDLTKVAALAEQVRNQIAPERVTRFVDLSCPDRVALSAPRVTLVVRLSAAPLFGPATESIRVVESGRIRVRLDAPGFDPIGPTEYEIAAADTPPVVFDLRPRTPGRHRLLVDFFQDGHHAGGIAHDIECVEQAEPVAFAASTAPLRGTPAVAPPDLVLLVGTREERLTFTLMRHGAAWSRNFTGEFRNAATYATHLYRDLAGFATRSEPVAAAHGLPAADALTPREIDRSVRTIGRNLWDQLFPRDFKELYAEHRDEWRGGSLLVLSDEPHIPWELVWPYGTGYADEHPWCGTFGMTRWLRLDEHGEGSEGPPARLRLGSLALFTPEDSGLPAVRAERDELARLMTARGVSVATPPATLDAMLSLLEGGEYDWIHAATHGNFHGKSPEGHSALWLEARRPFTPNHVVGPEIEAHLRKSRPAFVFNACHGGRQAPGLTGLAGWAARLIGRGAGLFAGALWQITDDAAHHFVARFYAHLLAGKTVGEAQRLARLDTRARAAGDPTWLAYSIYAHPNATVTTAP